MPKRVGIIGYGCLGKYLANEIIKDKNYELAFIWNRTRCSFDESIPLSLMLDDLKDIGSTKPDLVIEVAHPVITRDYGELILQQCDFMLGSPTALCDEVLLQKLIKAAGVNGLYVPSGAFWGGEDINKMANAGIIKSLEVTMRKHPRSLKLEGHLKVKNAEVKSEAVTLYHGSVRKVCKLAPMNTNTMAVAAIAAPQLGFDGVMGRLVSDPNLEKYHIVEVEICGYPKEDGTFFHVHTIRKNPSQVGAVTGATTYAAFYQSLKRAQDKGPGIHLC